MTFYRESPCQKNWLYTPDEYLTTNDNEEGVFMSSGSLTQL